jgi:hypothetical protein
MKSYQRNYLRETEQELTDPTNSRHSPCLEVINLFWIRGTIALVGQCRPFQTVSMNNYRYWYNTRNCYHSGWNCFRLDILKTVVNQWFSSHWGCYRFCPPPASNSNYPVSRCVAPHLGGHNVWDQGSHYSLGMLQ